MRKLLLAALLALLPLIAQAGGPVNPPPAQPVTCTGGNSVTALGYGTPTTCGTALATGTINTGAVNQLGVYSAATTISPLAIVNNAVLVTSAAGIPSESTTLPSALTIPAPIISTITNGAATLTLPTTTDTLVGRATTDTLTNKTLTAPAINAATLSGTLAGTPTFSGNLTFSGVPIFSGLSVGTQVACLGVDASNNLVKNSAACGSGTGGGTPGGAAGTIQYNNAGAFGGFTASGDATINTGTGAVTVSSIGGKAVSLANTLTTAGNFALTLTSTAATNATLPSGTHTLLAQDLASANIFVGSAGGAAAAVAMSGDVSLTNTGAASVIRLRGVNVSASAPADTNVLCYVAASTNWAPCAASGGSGNVGTGTQFDIAYYASAGASVSALAHAPNAVLVTSATSAPSLSQTLPAAVQGNITSLGTVTGGVWNGSIVPGQYGGTGFANTGLQIILGGNFSTSGASAITLTSTGVTNVTLPTTGTLLASTLTSGNIFVGNASNIATGVAVSGDAALSNTGVLTVNMIGGKAITLGGTLTTTPANNVTFTTTGPTNVTLPTSGPLMSGTLTAGQIFVGSAGNIATGVAPSGDVSSISSAGVFTIGAIGGKAVTLGGSLTTSGAFATTLTVTAATNVTLPTSGTLLTNALPATQIYVGSAGGVATGVAPSGDISAITSAGAFTIANAAVSYAKMQNVAASRLLGNPTGAPAAPSEIPLPASMNFASNTLHTAAFTGDVTTAADSFATTIAAGAVGVSKLAPVAAFSFIGNATNASATPTAVGIPANMTMSTGSLHTVAFTGDVTTAVDSFATTIATNAVSLAKMAQIQAISFPCNPTSTNPATMTNCTFGTEFNFSGSTLHYGGNPNTVNRITTGVSNTLSTFPTAFVTELWKSPTAGLKTDTVLGCSTANGNNGFFLYEVDGQGTAGVGSITVIPSTGTIGSLASGSYVLASNFITAAFVCDAPNTNWQLVYVSAPGATVRSNTTTTLTIAGSDSGGIVQQNAATAVTATIGDTGSTGFPIGGYVTTIQNLGAGLITLTPTTQTINGNANLILAQNESAIIIALPNTGGGYAAIVISAQTQVVPLTWYAGINPTGISFVNFPETKRIVAIRCTVEAGIAGAGTIHVYKAASGTAIASGTDLTDSVSCNAFNPTLATDQNLATATPANWVVAAQSRLGIVTTGTGTNWTGGTGVGVVTVVFQ